MTNNKEMITEFAIMRNEEELLITEIRDETKIWELYGFLKIYMKDLENTLKKQIQPRNDKDRHLY